MSGRGEIVEGRNAVVEALRAGRPLSRVLIAEGTKPNPVLDEIRRRCADTGIRVEQVRRGKLDELSPRGAHQGVVAYASAFAYTPLSDIVATGRAAARSLVVVLDHVTDPGNLGAVARTCEAVGAHGLVIPKERSASVGAVAEKAAAGALSYLPVAQVPNLVQALGVFKDAGYWVAGAEEGGASDVWDAVLDDHLVLVAGAEGTGLARLTREDCDLLVSLPILGSVGSLNVAQAVTALSYEWLRRGHRE